MPPETEEYFAIIPVREYNLFVEVYAGLGIFCDLNHICMADDRTVPGSIFTSLLMVIMTSVALKQVDRFELSDINYM